MRSSTGLLTLVLSLRAVHGQATIYGVSVTATTSLAVPDPVISQSLNFIPSAVGPDGVTTYIEQVVESYEAFIYPDTTDVVLSTPITFDFIFAESSGGFTASGFVPPAASASATFPGDIDSCTFDGSGNAVCVDIIPDGLGQGAHPLTLTRSGTLVPIFTLGAPTPAASTSTTTTNAAPRSTVLSAMGYFLGALMIGWNLWWFLLADNGYSCSCLLMT
ncbi:hypothetical protein C8F01DRAFT_1363407 [Mycena amicta]|nr:hypothetical protein C8F01DRAFT_1363407 [Mycena amicta]